MKTDISIPSQFISFITRTGVPRASDCLLAVYLEITTQGCMKRQKDESNSVISFSQEKATGYQSVCRNTLRKEGIQPGGASQGHPLPCPAEESTRAPRFQQPTFGVPSIVSGAQLVLFSHTPLLLASHHMKSFYYYFFIFHLTERICSKVKRKKKKRATECFTSSKSPIQDLFKPCKEAVFIILDRQINISYGSLVTEYHQ